MTDIIKLNAKFPIKMTINQFKKWYYDNKEAVHQLSSKYINHRIIIVDDKNNEYKFIRRKDEGQIIPREKLKSKQQIIDDVEQLKTLYKELEFMEEKLRHYGDLLVMKGIDVETVGAEGTSERRRDAVPAPGPEAPGKDNKTATHINYGPV